MKEKEIVRLVEDNFQIYQIESYSAEAAINDIKHIHYSGKMDFSAVAWFGPHWNSRLCERQCPDQPVDFEIDLDDKKCKMLQERVTNESDYIDYLESLEDHKIHFMSNKGGDKPLKTYLIQVRETNTALMALYFSLGICSADDIRDCGSVGGCFIDDVLSAGLDYANIEDELYPFREMLENEIDFKILPDDYDPKPWSTEKLRFEVEFNDDGSVEVWDNRKGRGYTFIDGEEVKECEIPEF